MTASTVVLNVGTGGSQPLVDTLSTVDGATAPTDAVAQAVKIGYGATGDFKTVTLAQPLPVVLASAASNTWGQALAVTAGATGTLASIASSVAGYQITGLVAHGTGDGYWFLQVASVTVLSGRTRSTSPTLALSLPNGVSVPTGSLVTLKVTNEAGSTADFEATLLGA